MEDSPKKEMAFVDHLEELRWHLIRSVVAVLVITVIAFFSMGYIFHHIILAPTRPDFWTYRMLCYLGEVIHIPDICITHIEFQMQNRSMAGQFTTHFMASFITGIVVAFPYIFWELWRFIRPGLHSIEQQYSKGAILFVTVLFVSGILFGYYIITPMSVNFLINYKLDDSIANIIDLSSYISFVCMLVLGSGIMFQLPVAIYILSKIGIVGPSFLRKYRRHAYVVIMFISAIVTPTPDMLTLVMVAIPLIILYEISIFISASVSRRKEKDIQSY